MIAKEKILRDVFIEQIYDRMSNDDKIFFLSADFGAPMLDKLRRDFTDRFINVGIAEQNLVNVSAGLALEGFTVYAYAIAPFLTMRAYEQIRINLAMLSKLREVNVNLIGVGAGLSYDVSGPTHHCLEDLGIMMMLPNMSVVSPCDWMLVEKLVDYTLYNKSPKYIRLDGKPLPNIYRNPEKINIKDGFFELFEGEKICIISTGYMTHKAERVRRLLSQEGIDAGIIDVFLLKPINKEFFLRFLSKYELIVTMEEAFVAKGGLDALVLNILNRDKIKYRFKSFGFDDAYVFEIGSREYLHGLNGLADERIADCIEEMSIGI